MLAQTPRPDLLSRARPLSVVLLVCVSLALGFGTVPADKRSTLLLTSSCLGWAYFSCWSLSFYPQTVLNIERRSVVGLSFDFALLNFVGACA